jgi:hypothetical protein
MRYGRMMDQKEGMWEERLWHILKDGRTEKNHKKL